MHEHHPRSQSPIIRLFFPYRNPSVKSPDGDPLTGDAFMGHRNDGGIFHESMVQTWENITRIVCHVLV